MQLRFPCPWRRSCSVTTGWHRVVVCLVLLCVVAVGQASDSFTPTPEEVFAGAAAAPWHRVERLHDPHPGFPQETFRELSEQRDPLIRRWFGNDATPHSGRFLLHCAPNWSGKTLRDPVLLIHGAGDNANRGWIHPLDALLPKELPQERQGFALTLSQLGYAVFAVTFAHNQGDNFYQAEHVANAIQRIRVLLKRTDDPNFKVDLIAHSKGNVAARLYCSDGRRMFPKKAFLSRFRHDVDQYIAIAAPFRGIDTAFRYYLYNLTVAAKEAYNAPIAADRLLLNGKWRDMKDRSLFPDTSANPFPGQCQLLYDLAGEDIVPLDSGSYTLGDANVTMNALYFGGASAFLASRGIRKAIDQGERLMYRLEEQGLEPSIRLGVIAGKRRYISWYLEGWGYVPMPHEVTAPPGDGVVFLKSATAVQNSLRRGARLLGVEILDFNHLGVACREPAFKIIDAWLLPN